MRESARRALSRSGRPIAESRSSADEAFGTRDSFVAALLHWRSRPEPQDVRQLYTSRDAAGRERVYRVPESRLLATRRFTPESESPPLSIPAAVAAAVNRLSAGHPGGVRVIQVDMIASSGGQSGDGSTGLNCMTWRARNARGVPSFWKLSS